MLYQNFNLKSLLDLRSNFYTYIFAYFKKRVDQATDDADFVLDYAIKHAKTREEQEAVCSALKFKTDVLWVMQDALYHAYINGHVPPGAFLPEDFNDRYIEN